MLEISSITCYKVLVKVKHNQIFSFFLPSTIKKECKDNQVISI